ncbi:hypothetical protein ACOSP7_014928 [Xanthoceras sorbifolium]
MFWLRVRNVSICCALLHVHAEALALLCAVQLAIDAELTPAVSDAASVVELVRIDEPVLSALGLLIDSIKAHVAANRISEVVFAPRAANMVADGLAKYGLISSDDNFLIDSFPS